MYADTIPWQAPEAWADLWGELKILVLMYMEGKTYADIAARYLNIPLDQITGSRISGQHPIPKIISFISDVIDRLAIDAGCFLAIHQGVTFPNISNTPETLQALPLCIKHGCDSLSVLSWYRFGYQQRVCAHVFHNKFPVPVSVINDKDRGDWVSLMKDSWLADMDESSENLLKHVAIVLTHS